MDNFYPKNFILWRPLLILLLIFLEAIYDCTGKTSFEGGDSTRIKRKLGGFKASCKVENDCKGDFFCDTSINECHCRDIPAFDTKLHMFYNEKTGTCQSAVGKVCTRENDGLWPIKCVPNANCIPDSRLPDNLGICVCASGFEESPRHLCEIYTPIIQFGDRPIVTMAQVQTPSTEGKTGRSENDPDADISLPPKGESNGMPVITSEGDDLNSGIRTDRLEKNNYIPNTYFSSGPKCNPTLYIYLLVFFIIYFLL